MIEIPGGHLYLGETIDPARHQRTGEPVLVEAANLTTHAVIVGMTGSGKTGLGVVLLEEALLQGIPTLIVDPKGDLGNLLLAFPDLAPDDFAPWVEEGDAAGAAAEWKEGLADWGIEPARIAALEEAATFTIYTPGSTSGVPLNIVGSLRRPADGTDAETTADEIEGFVSGLLRMVGIDADPHSSKEHILLTNLVAHAWSGGTDLDLPTLVAQVPDPPLRKLGIFELDSFFPKDERTKLAMTLNGLLASPSFGAWAEGDPLDMDTLLGGDGKPACAIVSLSHLGDEERQFVVSLILGKLITWMRRQPGTDRLRVLTYFDEVMGFVPPNGAPPAKKPILTLLKQARAFGVGLVLATQNPVDVDYKGLSNAGTWMIGRLQTEQDKARLLDGLSSAAGGVDVGVVSDTISGLGKREFVLRQLGQSTPSVFTTRWTMSYLRGPLTRDQIATLMADRRSAPEQPAPAPPSQPATTGDAVAVAPRVAEGIPVRWLDPAAPWAGQIGAAVTGTRFAPAIVARVALLYDDSKVDLRHTEEWEAVVFPLTAHPDPAAAIAVDHDDRDLRAEAPAGATYVIGDARLDQAGLYRDMEKGLVDHLYRNRTVEVRSNRKLKLVSRPGESEDDFAARCAAAAEAGADADQAELTAEYEARIERARVALATAEDRVDQAEAAQKTGWSSELLEGAGSVLGALLGGKRSARAIAREVGRAGTRRGRGGEAAERVESAEHRVEEQQQALADLEADLADELAAIDDRWQATATAIETIEVGLEKSDIQVTQLALVWVPVA